MNPIEFLNKGYASLLEANKNKKCQIQVLGPDGFTLTGLFLGISKCSEKELTDTAGFCTGVPIYKLCIMANEPDRIIPVWINTLLIDDITDIQFLD